MKAKIEIRECDWVNGRVVKYQAHAYWDSKRLTEPMISGLPQKTKDKAKASLWMTIAQFKELINGVEIL